MSPISPTTILLVDGYNIIGLWSDLQQIRDNYGLEPARRALTERLIGYSTFHGFDARVIFDSQYRNSRSHRETITPHLCLVYTDFGQTADTHIEKACAAIKREAARPKRRTIVATSDRAQQLVVVGYGAEWMSARQLASEVETSNRRVRRRQQNAPARSSRRLLSNALDPASRQRLAQWQQRL
ncbi:NYN domain-containing protein [Oscillatoriales cyanobacterium LEGE 11467]|uniref:NYN domain-containing protein n=1 Tax=Zarconia navalis LEGE 11467 TaxID=1828826 RepID=A0A928VW71_9CYAN|nr:NYN domain-containing protein [Zarconia navalis]MBE9040413.1 NYN domain-containing protein [Zarconia navalis LEGE 11467]